MGRVYAAQGFFKFNNSSLGILTAEHFGHIF